MAAPLACLASLACLAAPLSSSVRCSASITLLSKALITASGARPAYRCFAASLASTPFLPFRSGVFFFWFRPPCNRGKRRGEKKRDGRVADAEHHAPVRRLACRPSSSLFSSSPLSSSSSSSSGRGGPGAATPSLPPSLPAEEVHRMLDELRRDYSHRMLMSTMVLAFLLLMGLHHLESLREEVRRLESRPL